MSGVDMSNEDLFDEWQEERMFDELAAERARVATATAMPAPPFECVARCGCGVVFDKDSWKDMPLLRVVRVDSGKPVSVRRCVFCRSEVVK